VPRPEIIAHRGASRERPENTLAAFSRAAELGADGCEFDVHLHPDGVLRVHHDPFSPGSPLPTGPSAPPTLADVLSLHRERGLVAYAELKGPGSAPGTIAAIQTSGVRAAVHAFDHRQVAEAQLLAPSLPRGVLEIGYPVDPLHALLGVGGRDLWRQWPFIDEALVAAAHAAGCRVVAWTVNDAALMERLGALGVDAICTDDVALARTIFE
jgi:glycerophosphoryl diester phosphodiesterase